MKQLQSTALISLAIIIAAASLAWAYKHREDASGSVHVTGLGKANFSSDLIVWGASFGESNMDLKGAYAQLEASKSTISDYLLSKGVKPSEIVFSAVDTQEMTRRLYTERGDYKGEEFSGFRLNQSLELRSNDVDKVEAISREVTELLNQGVDLNSHAPRYYYTKLADLKVEMISKASEDARVRAEMIAQHAGGGLGELKSAKMGVFQITGQNSGEDYSWGGTFNTSSREKTASITMKLIYATD